MSRQVETNELRKVVAISTSEVEVPEPVVDSARFALKSMVDEAAEYGFSEADVIRAVFKPVFRKVKGCECYSCKARRSEGGEHSEGQNKVHVSVD